MMAKPINTWTEYHTTTDKYAEDNMVYRDGYTWLLHTWRHAHDVMHVLATGLYRSARGSGRDGG